jgi:hypothetical protein
LTDVYFEFFDSQILQKGNLLRGIDNCLGAAHKAVISTPFEARFDGQLFQNVLLVSSNLQKKKTKFFPGFLP